MRNKQILTVFDMPEWQQKKDPLYYSRPPFSHTVLIRHIALLSKSRAKRQNEEGSPNRDRGNALRLPFVAVRQTIFLDVLSAVWLPTLDYSSYNYD